MGNGDRQRMAGVVVVLLAAGAGCTELPDLIAGECGNQVLEPGEDCDGASGFEGAACGPADDEANACFYVCATAPCPAGWGCGADGRCRQHAGYFAEATGSPWDFDATDFAIGDVDGDGLPDLLGNDQSSLTARWGDGAGGFPGAHEVLGREPTGPVTYTQFDADARLDAVVPTASGLFALRGQANRTLDPIAYSPFELALQGAYRVTPMESDRSNTVTEVLVIVDQEDGPALMAFIDSNIAPAPLPGGHVVGDLTARLPVADLDGDGRDEIALAFTGENRIWIYSTTGGADGGTLGLELWQQLSLPLGQTVSEGALFVTADNDLALDLMVAGDITAQDGGVLVAYGDGTRAGLAALAVEPVFAVGSGWPLAAPAAGTQLLTPYALFSSYWGCGACTEPSPPDALFPVAYPATNYWTEGGFGDFNGDGQLDFAAIAEGAEAIDVYLNANSGFLYNRFHIDTGSPPRSLRIGDFDGDLVADIAFVASGQGVAPDGLAVIFGAASSGPSAAVSMGRTGYIEALEPVSATLTAESVDGITDLFAISASFPDAESRAVAIMLGSSSRSMISPFALIPEEDAPFPDVPLRALVADFDGDGARDVGAVAFRVYGNDPAGGGTTVTDRFLFYGIPGKGENGDLDAASAFNTPVGGGGVFDAACATWAIGDVDGDGVADVIGVDRGLLCAGAIESLPPRLAIGQLTESGLEAAIDDLPASDLRVVIDLELDDLDLDGDLDLVVLAIGDLFVTGGDGGSGPEGSADGRGLVVLWNDGSGAFGQPTELSLEGAQFVIDAVPVDLAPGQPRSLALFSEVGSLLVRADADVPHEFGPPEPVHWATGEGRIKCADLDRDGLADLVVNDGARAYVLLGQAMPPLGGGEGVVGGIEPFDQ